MSRGFGGNRAESPYAGFETGPLYSRTSEESTWEGDLAEEHVVEHEVDEEEEPRGTVVMMALFLLIIIGIWVYTYALLLERAG